MLTNHLYHGSICGFLHGLMMFHDCSRTFSILIWLIIKGLWKYQGEAGRFAQRDDVIFRSPVLKKSGDQTDGDQAF